MAYARSRRGGYRRSSTRYSAVGSRGRSGSGSKRRVTTSRRSSQQVVRLVIESAPASSVSREVMGVAAKINPPPKKSKF